MTFEEEVLGRDPGRPCGNMLLVKIFVRPERTEGGLLMPDATLKSDEFNNRMGIVLAMGPDCYSDKEWFPSGKYCDVGDKILWERHHISVWGIIKPEDKRDAIEGFEATHWALGEVPCNKVIHKFPKDIDFMDIDTSMIRGR